MPLPSLHSGIPLCDAHHTENSKFVGPPIQQRHISAFDASQRVLVLARGWERRLEQGQGGWRVRRGWGGKLTRKGEDGGGGGKGNFTLQREGGGGVGLFLGYSSKEGEGRGGRGTQEWCVWVTPRRRGSWWTSAAKSLFASRGSSAGTAGERGGGGGGRGGEGGGGGGEGTAAAAGWPPLQRGSGTPNFTTARPTNTVTNTVLPSDDVMGTKAGSPASPEPTFWQVCSTVCLVTRPGLGVRGRSSWETSRSVCLVTRPGLAPGVVGPSTVSTTNKIQILLIAGGQRPHRQASNLRERERFWR